jgi:hypothetical protein
MLLKYAAELDLKERRVKYTRGTFNFPAVQVSGAVMDVAHDFEKFGLST